MRSYIIIAAMFINLAASAQRYVEVSKNNPAYFALSDGTTYIPIGINLINPGGGGSNADTAFAEIEAWMKNLSENRGNYIRIWLSQNFWDVETEAGKYNEEKAKRIDTYIALARKYNLRIKLTLEHFRSLTLEENPQRWATKFAYHKSNGGPLDSIGQYLSTMAGRDLFLNKVKYYQERYGTDTLFFGWELWNEMNAVKGPENEIFFEWNTTMLSAVKQAFPQNLVMQSLGSFDTEQVRQLYERMMKLPGNEVAQVHRYLDLGAKLKVCSGSMDEIASSAVRDLQEFALKKPIIVAETGAVEPKHTGPFKLYARDTAGILLHDLLFAPFFSGAAAPGMSWHWESYVHKNNLWFHYRRFAEAVKDIDPVKENFVPLFKETDRFRIYELSGKEHTLLWIRDKESTWRTELDQGIVPSIVVGAEINLPLLNITKQLDIYDPWNDKWSTMKSENGTLRLPSFRRSVVLRIKR